MNVTIVNIPDVSDYMEYITQYQISNDITVIAVYKTMFRSDDVLINLYLNEISEDTILIAGRKLTTGSCVCYPRNELGFNYWVHCFDIDCIYTDVQRSNAYKFYLQFTSYENEEWEIA